MYAKFNTPIGIESAQLIINQSDTSISNVTFKFSSSTNLLLDILEKDITDCIFTINRSSLSSEMIKEVQTPEVLKSIQCKDEFYSSSTTVAQRMYTFLSYYHPTSMVIPVIFEIQRYN